MNRYLGAERLSRTLLTHDGGARGERLSTPDTIDAGPPDEDPECGDADTPDRQFMDLAMLLMTSTVGVATEED